MASTAVSCSMTLPLQLLPVMDIGVHPLHIPVMFIKIEINVMQKGICRLTMVFCIALRQSQLEVIQGVNA